MTPGLFRSTHSFGGDAWARGCGPLRWLLQSKCGFIFVGVLIDCSLSVDAIRQHDIWQSYSYKISDQWLSELCCWGKHSSRGQASKFPLTHKPFKGSKEIHRGKKCSTQCIAKVMTKSRSNYYHPLSTHKKGLRLDCGGNGRETETIVSLVVVRDDSRPEDLSIVDNPCKNTWNCLVQTADIP